ncbi:MAG: SatD family protein [Clostridia bacterium]|nr:SatD family protein [Clostridia bacterium]
MVPAGEFVAVKIDIRRSRRIRNREQGQEQFFETVAVLNREFADSIQARFVVTHGDEAQGMLKADAARDAFPIVERATSAMSLAELRFGIGLGALATSLRPEAIGMDGEAWYRAGSALDTAKTRKKYVVFDGFGDQVDKQLCAMANLLLYLRNGWSDQQRRVVELVDAGNTQSAAAALLGVTEAAVSQRLRAAGWHFYRDGRDIMASLLTV